MQVPCPLCKKLVEYSTDNIFRPFCSARCQSNDMAAWATGQYRVETPLSPEEVERLDNGRLSEKDRDDA